MIQSVASEAAKKYFTESLNRADYYINDQELKGRFFGNLSARLGLKEEVTKDSFYKLCDNINPNNGSDLTSRTIENRTVGYDINFHCPKSVSILHVLSKDDHLLKAFQDSVRSTMFEIEKDAKARVRIEGRNSNRYTRELVWSEFIHQTARPVEGRTPDPH
jgi:conjugative relaxase-like TrwC/TraI family protein